ncbi:MAG: endonuclease III domain-containing protein [Thermovirgaceae bacterium]
MARQATLDTKRPSSKRCPLEDFLDPGHLLRCLDILETTWKQESSPAMRFDKEPLDSLVRTVLSQNTNDTNRDRAYENLRRYFPDWKDILGAETDKIAEAIKTAGLSNTKASRIKKILETVKMTFGVLSLEKMKEWDNSEARRFLQDLPGVGPKTAACVLLFDLHMPAFPVDTHVARVSRRIIGWAPARATPEAIQGCLETVIPPNRYLGAHLNLIFHGRNICLARKPGCLRCPIADLCLTGKEKLKS